MSNNLKKLILFSTIGGLLTILPYIFILIITNLEMLALLLMIASGVTGLLSIVINVVWYRLSSEEGSNNKVNLIVTIAIAWFFVCLPLNIVQIYFLGYNFAKYLFSSS